MTLQVAGCNHLTPLAIRERLAFSSARVPEALARYRARFPHAEGVLLSTCNRTEIYAAGWGAPTGGEIAVFLAELSNLPVTEVQQELFFLTGDQAIRHLFAVAASLDSMVLGETQILRQVKDAYQVAAADQSAGQVTHTAFQAAIRVAKRIATETALHQHRVSIASVAVHDFAMRIFEDLADKSVLVIGAGETAAETVRALREHGATEISIINRTKDRAAAMASHLRGRVRDWSDLRGSMVDADLVISATGADEYLMTHDEFAEISQSRQQRPMMIMDLAVPRDFDPRITHCLGVYLYTIDDLRKICDNHREKRQNELPRAWSIIDQETERFMGEIRMDSASDTIRQLKANAEQIKNLELARLWNRLPQTDEPTRAAVEQAFNRLTNKLLHPPLDSLRREVHHEVRQVGMLEALRRLFQIGD